MDGYANTKPHYLQDGITSQINLTSTRRECLRAKHPSGKPSDLIRRATKELNRSALLLTVWKGKRVQTLANWTGFVVCLSHSTDDSFRILLSYPTWADCPLMPDPQLNQRYTLRNRSYMTHTASGQSRL
jgi:hypothetical protein